MNRCVILASVAAISSSSVDSGVLAASAATGGLRLARQGKTEYRVVIPRDAEPVVRAAANELVLFLEEVTGAKFPVVGDEQPAAVKEILLGQNARLKEAGVNIEWNKLGREGYVIRTVGERLIIAGSSGGRGTINGVYVFLRDYLGCRWFTPDCSVIPKKHTLEVSAIDVQRVPPFELRYLSAMSLMTDLDWFARNHLNCYTVDVNPVRRPDGTPVTSFDRYRADPRLANTHSYAGWHWHSLGHNSDLLDPEKYFDAHPEYFSLVGGKRLRSEQQPCLTHPEVIKIVTENVKRRLRQDPRATLVDVSHGDYLNFCQCATCAVGYEKYGVSGVFAIFVNQVAAEIENEFPHIKITTLFGYAGLESLPLGGIKLHPNILVRAGDPSYCVYHNYEECPVNVERGKLQILKNWVAITPGGVHALEYPSGPGPMLHSISSQYKLLHRIGVRGIYAFSSEILKPWRAYWAEQTPDLRGYLHARLLWDPEFNVDKGIREFCQAYHGAAAAELIRFVRDVNDESAYAGKVTRYEDIQRLPGYHTGGRGNWDPLKPEKMRDFDRLFDRAEKKAANDAKSLQHIKTDRMALQYTILRQADTKNAIWTKAAKGFCSTAAEVGLKQVPNLKTGQNQDLDTFRRELLGEPKASR